MTLTNEEQKSYVKAYRLKNPDRYLETKRAAWHRYVLKNKEKIRLAHRDYARRQRAELLELRKVTTKLVCGNLAAINI
jgi:hypothetical protein